MKVRFLPQSEWSAKLADTPWAGVVAPPETTDLLIVEDDAGDVIGTWSVVILPHLEGFWVRPDHRFKAAVVKTLLSSMFDHLRRAGVTEVLTHAPGEAVDGFLTRLGGRALPGRAFSLPVPPAAPPTV